MANKPLYIALGILLRQYKVRPLTLRVQQGSTVLAEHPLSAHQARLKSLETI